MSSIKGIQRSDRAGVLLAMLFCAGFAAGAPVTRSDSDLFDHLATTFPIDDWVMRARARYDTLERLVPQESPRVHVPRADSVDNPETAYWGGDVSRCIRQLRRDTCRPAVVGDPCATYGRDAESRPDLPDHLGVRTLVSRSFGPGWGEEIAD